MNKCRWDVWKHFDNIEEEGVAVCKLCKQRLKNDRSYCLKMHLQKVHNAKSELWKYYDNVPGEGLAICRQCQHRVRNNRSSNLRLHLQICHNITIIDIQDVSEVRRRKNRTKVDDTIVNISDDDSKEDTFGYVTQRMHNDITIRPPEWKRHTTKQTYNSSLSSNTTEVNKLPSHILGKFLDIEMNETILMSAIWGLMLDEGVTPPLFGSKNMQSLLQPVCKAISKEENKEFRVDEAETERLLCLAANTLRNDITTNLDWRLLTLKIDMDVKGLEKFFRVSTLFIHDAKVHTRHLGIIDLKDDIQLNEQHIKEILYKYNIDSNQIINVLCNFINPKLNKHVENSEYLNEIQNFEYLPDIHFGDIKVNRYVGVLAQLSLLDIFKNNDIFQQFLVCRNLTKFVSDSSNGFFDLFEQNNLEIPELDSPWNWGSTYKMMSDLQQARIILNDVKYPKIENSEDRFNVDDNLWLFINAFCESLIYIQKSLVKYCNEELHFGDFYAQWLKSKLLTSKLVASADKQNNHYITMISKELLNCIEARSKEILNKDFSEACLYLDPRFQHTLGAEDKTKAVEYLKKLWSLSKIYNPDVINTATNCQEETNKSQSFADDEDAFLNEFLSKDAQELDMRTVSVYNKIEGLKLPFKSVDTDILLFWQNLKSSDPEMYELSSICFAIPTTQNYNQSRHAHIYKKETFSKISTFTKDNLIRVRLNSNLLLNGTLEKFGNFQENNSSDVDLTQDMEIVDSNEVAIASS